jgi:hypothetical protein
MVPFQFGENSSSVFIVFGLVEFGLQTAQYFASALGEIRVEIYHKQKEDHGVKFPHRF